MITEKMISVLRKCILMISIYNNGTIINKINISNLICKPKINFYKEQQCKIIRPNLISIHLIISMFGINFTRRLGSITTHNHTLICIMEPFSV